jgi:hypothetical protein
MTNEEMVKFLKRVYVWIPQNNPMRRELAEMVTRLGGRIPQQNQ